MRTLQDYKKDVNRRIHRLLEKDFSGSYMNDTKWYEVFQIRNLFAACRFKFVDVDEPSGWTHVWMPSLGWIDSFWCSHFLAIEIEWMEINPIQHIHQGMLLPKKVVDYTGQIETHLRDLNIPFERMDSYIRITGHQRKSQPLDS